MRGKHAHAEIREGCTIMEEMMSGSPSLAKITERIEQADRVYFVGCGSSYWTGVVGEYVLLEAGVDANAEFASEFIFKECPVSEGSLVIGISQSGETTETVQAIEHAADLGAQTAAITNGKGSRLDEKTDASYVTPAGDEHAVMATKSVDAAITAIYLIANRLRNNSYDLPTAVETCKSIFNIDLSSAVELLQGSDQIYTLGTGSFYGVAGEAATKFGESTLQHATPLPTLEINHGPIANVSGDLVLLFAFGNPNTSVHQDIIDRLIDAGAQTLVIHPAEKSYHATTTLSIEQPTATVLPSLKLTQLLAENGALAMDLNPDNPPELSKHVEISEIEETG